MLTKCIQINDDTLTIRSMHWKETVQKRTTTWAIKKVTLHQLLT